MSQFTTKFDATTGKRNGIRLSALPSLMDPLARVLVRLGILTEDLDYHLIRASMVIIFLFFGYQKRRPGRHLVFGSLGVVVRCALVLRILE